MVGGDTTALQLGGASQPIVDARDGDVETADSRARELRW